MKKNKYKNPMGVLIGLNQKFARERKDGTTYTAEELFAITSEKLGEINRLEKFTNVRLNNWKGKSGMKIIENPDFFICETYQKKDQDSRPKKSEHIVEKEKVNDVIKSINKLNNEGRKDKYWSEKQKNYLFPTRDIAEEYFGINWDEVFSTRKKHHELNYILRILDYLGKTTYRGGFTRITNKEKNMILLDIDKKTKSL